MAKEGVRQRTEQAVREGGGELKLAGKGACTWLTLVIAISQRVTKPSFILC